MKKSSLKRRGYGQTPRERAIELIRIAFTAEPNDRSRTYLLAARLLIIEATRK